MRNHTPGTKPVTVGFGKQSDCRCIKEVELTGFAEGLDME